MAESNEPLHLIEDERTHNRFLLYTTKGGAQLEVLFEDEEPWFTQADMAAMYGVDVRTANEHVSKFLEDGELDPATIRNFRIVRQEGARQVEREIIHYGLDVAFYVGYRVNSNEGKLFRRWATASLVQLAKYGFVVDKRKLRGDPDRLTKLRLLIQDLRNNEANIYAELRRILSMCQDYDARDALFFANFQNRLLYAITSYTAAELLVSRANASKPNMGLQAWDEDRDYPILEDAKTSKNYLGEFELEDLNRLVGMVLDFFEDQTRRGWLVSMADADAKLGEIFAVNKRHMLKGFGRVEAEDAKVHVKAQYDVFDKQRRAVWKAEALAELQDHAKAISAEKKRKGKGDGSPEQPAKRTKRS
jgi:hypothetical protein